VRQLLDVLDRLVDRGNTVVVIEHNTDVMARADWILDLGPGGGDDGGRVVAEGTPEAVARSRDSKTGEALRQYFESRAQSGARGATEAPRREAAV
jgi:excinuclease ABC subunit A